jgi:hypothetical protein
MKWQVVVCWGIILALSHASCHAAPYYPKAKITLVVVDDEGRPVEGARAGVTFDIPPEGETKGGTPKNGESDRQGLYSTEYISRGYVHYGADKEGYYSYRNRFRFNKASSNKWQPWNPTLKVVLKKIVSPVPMYGRRAQIEIPAADAEFGYDLIEADWVAPHGKGKSPDFIFRVGRRFNAYDDFNASLALTFPNKGDGIQIVVADPLYGSDLRLPRLAPTEGYQNRLVINRSRHGSEVVGEDHLSPTNYFFRVRTVLDINGNVISCMYGKIQRPLVVDLIGSKTATILFEYALNPDGTPNMEFDIQKNLFKKLKTDGPTRR